MSARNDGGPAFPLIGAPYDGVGDQPGMTLRDWFGGMALAALYVERESGHVNDHEQAAAYCYEAADAMLKAREEGQ